MNKKIMLIFLFIVVVGALVVFGNRKDSDQSTQGPVMSFFITSVNPGKGGDLGGLAGADAYCAKLAEAAGVSGKTWRAYLSTVASEGQPATNARERIGEGPWYNAKGEKVATTLAELHGENLLAKTTSLSERGEVVTGRGDAVNMHDILTGSTADGYASTTAATDTTCKNWTSSAEGSAIVGHHDRIGINDSAPMKSWNSSHATRGCSIDAFKSTGGAGLFYCFALNK
jgi:hypothetical protein